MRQNELDDISVVEEVMTPLYRQYKDVVPET